MSRTESFAWLPLAARITEQFLILPKDISWFSLYLNVTAAGTPSMIVRLQEHKVGIGPRMAAEPNLAWINRISESAFTPVGADTLNILFGQPDAVAGYIDGQNARGYLGTPLRIWLDVADVESMTYSADVVFGWI
jgi:hypothetical protein